MPSDTQISPIPAGYVAGEWDIDPVHSEVSFVVRHLMVSKVRGRFTKFDASITTAEDFLNSTVLASVDLSSIDTANTQRDDHLRSDDFFAADKHPTMTFKSTGIRATGSGSYLLDGDLTIREVTNPVTLALEVNGFGPDPWGGTRAGFTATGEINRQDFGVSFNGPIPGVGDAVMISDKVAITIEVEAILKTPDSA